jgi:hypothetical protein
MHKKRFADKKWQTFFLLMQFLARLMFIKTLKC